MWFWLIGFLKHTLEKVYVLAYNTFMKERVIEFFKINGKEPLQDWLNSLDKTSQVRILERFNRCKSGKLGDFKNIDTEISELRFKFGSGYRVYYSEINNILLLLICGGDKSTQTKDIKKAKEYLKIWKDYKNE